MLFEFLTMASFNLIFFVLYIANGNSFPKPLTAAKEKEYINLCRKGDKNARNKLIECNLRLVAHIIKKYYAGNRDQEDLISIGTIGLIKAVDSFNPNKGARLATYAARCIENEIMMYFRSLRKTCGDVSIDDSIDIDKDGNPLKLMDILSFEDDIDEDVDLKDNIELLKNCLDIALDPREMKIILLRYGLNRSTPLTQRETAKYLNISRSYVSRIEKKALAKLKTAFFNAK